MKRMLNCLKVEKCVFGVWVAAERRQRERESKRYGEWDELKRKWETENNTERNRNSRCLSRGFSLHYNDREKKKWRITFLLFYEYFAVASKQHHSIYSIHQVFGIRAYMWICVANADNKKCVEIAKYRIVDEFFVNLQYLGLRMDR